VPSQKTQGGQVTDRSHRRHEITFQIKREDLEEHIDQENAVTMPIEWSIPRPTAKNPPSKAEKWKITRVYYLLFFTSTACLITLIFSPLPVVQVAVLGIWTSTAALARYLLSTHYREANTKNANS
jgi:hypothetical protein